MKKRTNKILLTGSSGQLGWELRRTLLSIADIICPNRSEFDMAQPETLRDKIADWKPDLIVNAAAYTAVDQAESESNLAFIINAKSPSILGEEAEKLNIPMVHYSTDYVFDGNSATPYTENDDPNPLNVYGESKLFGDLSIQNTLEKHIILRTSWVYGLRGHNFLKTMLRLLHDNKEVKVIDDQIGTPNWSRFIAQVTAEILSGWIIRKDNPINNEWGLYNLSSDGECSWYDFAKSIQRKFDKQFRAKLLRIKTAEYNSDSRRPLFGVLDNNKLKSNFGIKCYNWIKYLELCAEM